MRFFFFELLQYLFLHILLLAEFEKQEKAIIICQAPVELNDVLVL